MDTDPVQVSDAARLPLISVIIPAKNGASTIEKCLRAIESQNIFDDTEIIVIDSGSTDGTLELTRSHRNVRVIEILPETFNHGGTRNLGASLAKGKYVVMTVQDAVPADDQWLQKLIRHFDDPAVAGVCGQQIVPHETDKNPHQWFRPQSHSGVATVVFPTRNDFLNLSPEKKKSYCKWDDVNAAYRKDVLLKIPFRDAFFAEDARWACDALEHGHTLVYDNNAKVYHYHFQTYHYTYKRTLTQLYFDYKIFGHQRSNGKGISEYLKIIYRNFKYAADLKWIGHNFQMLRARNRAFSDFNKYLQKGDSFLDGFYNEICKVPPQGRV